MKIFLGLILTYGLLSNAYAQDSEESAWVDSRSWRYTESNVDKFCFAESEAKPSAFTTNWGFDANFKISFPSEEANTLPQVQFTLNPVADEEEVKSGALQEFLESTVISRVQAVGVGRNSTTTLRGGYFLKSEKTEASYTYTYVYKEKKDLFDILSQIRLKGSLALKFKDEEGKDLSLVIDERGRTRKVSVSISLSGSSNALKGLSACLGIDPGANDRKFKSENYFLLDNEQVVQTLALIKETPEGEVSNDILDELSKMEPVELAGEYLKLDGIFFNSNFAEPAATELAFQKYLDSKPYDPFTSRRTKLNKEIKRLEGVVKSSGKIVSDSTAERASTTISLGKNRENLGKEQGKTKDLESNYNTAKDLYLPIKEERDPLRSKASSSWWSHNSASNILSGYRTEMSNENSSIDASNVRIQAVDSESSTKLSQIPSAEREESSASKEFVAFDFSSYKANLLRKNQSAINRHKRNIESLTTSNISLDESIRNNDARIREIGFELNTVRPGLSGLESIVSEANSLLTIANNDLPTKGSEISSETTSFERQEAEVKSAEEAVAAESLNLETLTATRQENLATVERLEKRIKRLRRGVDGDSDGDSDPGAIQEKIRVLQGEVNTLNNENRNLNRQINRAESSLDQAEGRLQTADAKLQEIEGSINQKKQIFEQFSGLIGGTSNEIRLKVIWTCTNPSRSNSFCQSDIWSVQSTLNDVVSNASSKLRTKRSQIEALEGEVDSLSSSNRTSISERSENTISIGASKDSIDAFETSAHDESLAKQASLSSALEIASAKLKSLRLAVTELAKEKLALQESILLSRQNISILITQIAEQEVKVANLKITRDADQKVVDDFDKEHNYANIQKDYNSKKDLYETNVATIKGLEEDIDRQVARISVLEQLIEEHSGKVKDSGETIEELAKVITDEIEPEIEKIDAKIQSFKNEISKINDERMENKAIRSFIQSILIKD